MQVSKDIFDLYAALKPFSKDLVTRGALDSVHLNESKMVVCNGHFLIEVDKPEALKETANINLKPLGTWKKGPFDLRNADKAGANLVTADGDLLEVNDGEYPDYKVAIPAKKGNVKIALNADYLVQIAKYLNREEKNKPNIVTLTIDLEENTTRSAIHVSGRDEKAMAIIMPA